MSVVVVLELRGAADEEIDVASKDQIVSLMILTESNVWPVVKSLALCPKNLQIFAHLTVDRDNQHIFSIH